jgi:hypothetical protein
MEMFWASAIAHSQILQHPQLKKDAKNEILYNYKGDIKSKNQILLLILHPFLANISKANNLQHFGC